MHHNYGVISGSHACRYCVWHTILDAEIYTTCHEERVLVATRFNATFLPEPDLPIGYIGLSLGLQDRRGPPTNALSQWSVYDHLQ